eukprot:CAMPEP_0168747438 /NCGR_PEP_ID=MMETSP0724-20121128/15658_1 /TAXON_ID=265536 /ORGANISM="Amphiprora sp., Strain CCMP467" /LENGTH=284 /DNA_ID=CAMNT_0008795231 /DNA_START=41 /DNA_END=895 /DNA_ORIENTATION=-
MVISSTPLLRIHTLIILISSLTDTTCGWTSVLPARRPVFLSPATPKSQQSSARIPRALFALSSSSTPGDDEEDECDSEEECEIDWDNMPGFDNDDDVPKKQQQEALSSSAAATTTPILEYNDFENDLAFPLESETILSAAPELTTTHVSEQQAQPSASRKPPSNHNNNQKMNWKHGLARMEMQWQMTESAKECDVDEPETCGSKQCEACHGSGHTSCRLCRGTHFIKLSADSDFFACKLCDENGQEICQACQGSGWVAEWTSMSPTVTHKGAFDLDSDSATLLP